MPPIRGSPYTCDMTLSASSSGVRALIIDPSRPDTLYLGTSGGEVYVSNDAGKSWQRVSFQLDDLVYTLGVVDARNAWARLDSQIPTRRGYGLALTKDGGAHWTYAHAPPLP